MKKMFRPTVVNIYKSHLRHNLKILKKMSGDNNFFCPMLKANAYGHGDIEVAKLMLAEGVQSLGVALVEEGARLREAKIKKAEILVFSPCLDGNSVEAILDYSLIPVLSSWEEIKILEKKIKSGAVNVHVKFNTGMSRLGFSIEEAKKLANYFKSNKKMRVSGLCSHLLYGEDYFSEKSRTRRQMDDFNSALNFFSGSKAQVHLLNSSALISHHCHASKEKPQYGSRPGISLYGMKPEIIFANERARKIWTELEFKPVMELKTKIIHLQSITKGDTVSYEGQFTASGPTLIGVLPIGYADGYMRNFSSKSQVLCRGKKVNVTGIVCMDYTMINLTDSFSDTKDFLNEEVILIGEQMGNTITAEDLAKVARTNSYEVMTQMSTRLPRVYK